LGTKEGGHIIDISSGSTEIRLP